MLSILVIFLVFLSAGPYRWAVFQPELQASHGRKLLVGTDDCPASLQWYLGEENNFGPAGVGENGCSVHTRGPWWLDSNHAWPFGSSRVHVLLHSGVRSLGLPVWGIDDRRGPLDLRGRTLEIDFSVSGTAGLEPIHFWVQSRASSGRYANYIDVRRLNSDLTAERRRYRLAVRLDRSSNFTCLGSNIRRAATYGCDISVNDALADVNADLGFLMLRRSSKPLGGTFELHKFRID